uniref:Uncharacterized protein n=1 Tax=Lygus hesperus TaxID=30085 RepID=A0A146L054_LYGHE
MVAQHQCRVLCNSVGVSHTTIPSKCRLSCTTQPPATPPPHPLHPHTSVGRVINVESVCVADLGGILLSQLGTSLRPVTETTTQFTSLILVPQFHKVLRVLNLKQKCRHVLLGLLQYVLQIKQKFLLAIVVHKGCGGTAVTASTGASDTVYVVLNLLGCVVVYYVLDAGEVQSFRPNVR